MKRLVIFVFYDQTGVLDAYVIKLLEEIRNHTDFIYTVINGVILEKGKQQLEKHSDKILIRENKGFDAGAIKDAIRDLSTSHMLEVYDELIIFNDTFYGFFYPLSDFFEGTKSEPEIDFWGFTEWPGSAAEDRIHVPRHLQSYFLYIKDRMLHSPDFLDFWNDMPYCEKFDEVLAKYEQCFTNYFNEKGFKSKAYYTVEKLSQKEECGKIPYFIYAYDFVAKLHFPILKCKTLSIEGNVIDSKRLMHYLEENKLYNINLIKEHAKRLENERAYFNLRELKKFCEKYKKIYIYGAGNYGKKLREFLESNGYQFGGFVVTEKKDTNGENIIAFENLKLAQNEGLIIGLIPQYTKEVLNEVKKKIPESHFFTGQYWK